MNKQDTEIKLITEQDNHNSTKKHRLFLCHLCVVMSGLNEIIRIENAC